MDSVATQDYRSKGAPRRIKLVSVLLVFLLCSFCSSGKKQEETAPPVTVTVRKVIHVKDFQIVPVTGSVVSPDAPSNVSFLVSGRVTQVIPREGEYVKKGQRLASIDPVDYRLAVNASQAQLEQAKVAFQRAEDEYERMKFLYETKSLAPNDFQKFRAAFEAARWQIDQARAGEEISQKRLSDTSLYSPVNGFITKRLIEPGEMASAGRPVFEIARLDPVEVIVGVPETDVHLVKIGQKALVAAPALPGQSFHGTVRVVNVSADPSTRTYMTRITIPNPNHILKLGMVAEARIRSDKKIQVTTITGDAVVRDSRGVTSVFVYYPGEKRVYAKRVEIGTVYDRDLEVRSGLTGDELIVIAGQERLRDGTLVSLANSETGGPAASPKGR